MDLVVYLHGLLALQKFSVAALHCEHATHLYADILSKLHICDFYTLRAVPVL